MIQPSRLRLLANRVCSCPKLHPASAACLFLALAQPTIADEANPKASLTTTGTPQTQALELALPKPMFTGTPKDIKSTNFEKPLPGKRPVYQVPAGTVLLSKGKPVTSSDPAPILGDVEMVTDGNKEANDGGIVEIDQGKQYVQIDLGKQSELAALVVWHYHQEGRVYRDVVIQVAEDPDFIMGVTTLFNNDDDNSSGLGLGKDKEYLETHEGKLVDAKGAKGRYLRLYSNGNTSNEMNHYIEVEVYGKALE